MFRIGSSEDQEASRQRVLSFNRIYPWMNRKNDSKCLSAAMWDWFDSASPVAVHRVFGVRPTHGKEVFRYDNDKNESLFWEGGRSRRQHCRGQSRCELISLFIIHRGSIFQRFCSGPMNGCRSPCLCPQSNEQHDLLFSWIQESVTDFVLRWAKWTECTLWVYVSRVSYKSMALFEWRRFSGENRIEVWKIAPSSGYLSSTSLNLLDFFLFTISSSFDSKTDLQNPFLQNIRWVRGSLLLHRWVEQSAFQTSQRHRLSDPSNECLFLELVNLPA